MSDDDKRVTDRLPQEIKEWLVAAEAYVAATHYRDDVETRMLGAQEAAKASEAKMTKFVASPDPGWTERMAAALFNNWVADTRSRRNMEQEHYAAIEAARFASAVLIEKKGDALELFDRLVAGGGNG